MTNNITTESIKAIVEEIVRQALTEMLAERGLLAQAEVTQPEAEPKSAMPKAEQRERRQQENREAAAWMRDRGLMPAGQAWVAYKDGERSIAMLSKLNTADGHPIAQPKAEPAPTATKAPGRKAATPKVTTPKAATPKAAATTKAATSKAVTTKARAPRKTTKATPKPVQEITTEPSDQLLEIMTDPTVDPSFTESSLQIMDDLRAKGLTEEQIVLALAEHRKAQG